MKHINHFLLIYKSVKFSILMTQPGTRRKIIAHFSAQNELPNLLSAIHLFLPMVILPDMQHVAFRAKKK